MSRQLWGHSLAERGTPVSRPGCPEDDGDGCVSAVGQTGGWGHARCTCGAVSEEHLPTRAARGRWQAGHRDEVSAAGLPTVLQQSAPVARPNETPEQRARMAYAVGGERPEELTGDDAVAREVTLSLLRNGVLPEPRYLEAAAARGVPYGVVWKHGAMMLAALRHAGYEVRRAEA